MVEMRIVVDTRVGALFVVHPDRSWIKLPMKMFKIKDKDKMTEVLIQIPFGTYEDDIKKIIDENKGYKKLAE